MKRQIRRWRRFFLIAQSSSMMQMLGDAIEEKIGLYVTGYLVDDRYPNTLDEVEKEKIVPGLEGLILVTDSCEAKAAEFYAFWHGHFPELPLVWCHSDTNEEFFGNKEWTGVTWVDLDVMGRKNAFIELTKILDKIAV